MKYIGGKRVAKALKTIVICGLLFILSFFFMLFFADRRIEDISCYFDCQPASRSTESISLNEPSNRSIFFLETYCFGNEEITISPRKICAVESAARLNPTMTVHLFFLSHGNWSVETEETIKRLNSRYKNIIFERIVAADYMKKTPLEKWWASGIFKSSYWPRSHISDVLRYVTLWKFGGIYLDLDIVVKSSLENITNFVGAESSEDINAAVFGLGSTGLGRKVAEACMEDLKEQFRGDDWGNNGPGVITRVLQKLCGTDNVAEMNKERCQGFNVYPPSAFFPIYFKRWYLYFTNDAKDKKQTINDIQESLTIHLWNKFSESEPVQVGSDVPYATIANKYCPYTYKNCGDVF